MGWIADKMGFKEKEIPLNGKKVPVKELVPAVKLEKPERIVVLINHKGASIDSLVSDEDYVAVLPVIGGG